eukprot:SAG11_NODE_16296_length_551_cov_2.336283_1_plen_57_part_10
MYGSDGASYRFSMCFRAGVQNIDTVVIYDKMFLFHKYDTPRISRVPDFSTECWRSPT